APRRALRAPRPHPRARGVHPELLPRARQPQHSRGPRAEAGRARLGLARPRASRRLAAAAAAAVVHARPRVHAPAPGAPSRAPRRIRVVAAVVWDGPRLLMTQRPAGGPLGLQWEFPGGKIEAGESPEQAIVREVHEELGVVATPQGTVQTVSHDYAHGTQVEI